MMKMSNTSEPLPNSFYEKKKTAKKYALALPCSNTSQFADSNFSMWFASVAKHLTVLTFENDSSVRALIFPFEACPATADFCMKPIAHLVAIKDGMRQTTVHMQMYLLYDQMKARVSMILAIDVKTWATDVVRPSCTTWVSELMRERMSPVR